MTAPLHVIALVSGGKDSLFSLLHVLANGHTIVALANLHPPSTSPHDDAHDQKEEDDLNSYMYQTVGHSTIPLYASALNLPLYRQPITGAAVNSSRDYASTSVAADEAEDLVPLLLRVKAAHPEANALSTGAIFSAYQRTRVESVAARLGLVSLAYLWRWPLLPPYLMSSLLADMRAVGMEARIVKVASGGLDEGFVWADVTSEKTVERLKRAVARFGGGEDGALVGEGGEFETLALDGPGVLWKGRVVVEGGGVVGLGGGVAVWKGGVARVVEKVAGEENVGLERLRRPQLFDDEFAKLLEKEVDLGPDVSALPHQDEPSSFASLPTNVLSMRGNTFTYANITGETAPCLASTPQIQLTNILLRLDHALQLHSIPRPSITQCTLLLRHMSDFSSLNAVYGKYFNYTNPPSRVTIAVADLPPSISIMLSVTAHKNTPRNGLHVQSHSYWAPANIGPYSQAISVPLSLLPSSSALDAPQSDSLPPVWEVYVAGQIPLVPASMQLYADESAGFKGEALLSLQHLYRIGRATGVKWWNAAVVCIPFSTNRAAQHERVRLVQALWREIVTASIIPPSSASATEDGDEMVDEVLPDPWAAKNWSKQGPTFVDYIPPMPIPDPTIFSPQSTKEEQFIPPPCFVVEVAELPRSASIEWVCVGLDVPARKRVRTWKDGCVWGAEVGHAAGCVAVEVDVGGIEKGGHDTIGLWTGTLYVADARAVKDCEVEMGEGVAWVPCRRIWGQRGREMGGVFVGGKTNGERFGVGRVK